jgi:hypothetical protein
VLTQLLQWAVAGAGVTHQDKHQLLGVLAEVVYTHSILLVGQQHQAKVMLVEQPQAQVVILALEAVVLAQLAQLAVAHLMQHQLAAMVV